MSNCSCYENSTLPDIEMYGGDNTPWEITLVKPNGTRFTAKPEKTYTATLSLIPIKVSSGISANASIPSPVLEKTGNFNIGLDGTAIVIFNFAENDTKALRGKYVYQVEVTCGDDLRVSQGHLYIRQNINR